MTTTMKNAAEIVVGDFVVEADGSYFQVTSVARRGRRIALGLANVNGYMVAASEALVSARAMVRTLAA